MTTTFVRKRWTDQIIDRTKRSVTYTVYSKTINNNTGDEILTAGTPATKSVVYLRTGDKWLYDKEGLFEGGDAYAIVKGGDFTPTKNSLFTVDSETFIIHEVHPIYGDNNNETLLYYMCTLLRHTG